MGLKAPLLAMLKTVKLLDPLLAASISSSGALTPVPGSPFTESGVEPFDSHVMLLSPHDKTLFVSNQFSFTMTAFSVASDGSLSNAAGSPFPMNSGGFPSGMATSQDGSLLYVANGFNSISVFSIGNSGTLAEVAGSPFPTGQSGTLL